MEKELTFINLVEIKSKKNGKTYYKLATYDENNNILKEDFISKEVYEIIKNLELSFGENITIVYEINALNKCYIVSAQ